MTKHFLPANLIFLLSKVLINPCVISELRAYEAGNFLASEPKAKRAVRL